MSKTFSHRERLFLEFYFDGALMKDAVRAAGYMARSAPARCNTGRAILKKFEKSAPAKEIFKRVGASEVQIAQLLTSLVQNAKSESAQVRALGIIAKCMGMQRETKQ